MRILVGSDLGASASRAVSRGFQMAADMRADIRIVHAGAPDTLETARAHLTAEADRNKAWSGLEAGIVVTAGDSAAGIAAEAERWSADLIVMGSHNPDRRGPGAFSRTLAGRTLKRLGRPLLLAEAPVDGSHGTAVVGIDFSIFSRTAVHAARRFAPKALLHLVHAYRVPFNSWMLDKSYAQDFGYAERLAFDEFVAEEMALQRERALASGIPDAVVRTHVREGSAIETLRAIIGETGATLAVVGTHGRAGIAQLLLGSVAADLADDTPCDLLIVPMAIPADRNS